MSRTTLVIRYSAFAVIATLINLGAQRLVLITGDSGLHFALAIFIGTGFGLVAKYILDKRWIFRDLETGVQAHSKKFALYTVMGIVTTAIFWGTETAFWLVWNSHTARELGAVLGLAVGYVVKYHLDKHFVFRTEERAR